MPLGGLCIPNRQPNKLPNRPNKQKEPPCIMATSKIFLKQKGNVLITQNALFSILTANVDNLPLKHFKSILGRNKQ